MTYFVPINKWANKKLHLRNIEIALEVLNGNTYQDVAKLYSLSRGRVMQVYRCLAAKLYERNFGEPFHKVVFDKNCYRHKDMINIIRAYHRDYISWMIK